MFRAIMLYREPFSFCHPEAYDREYLRDMTSSDVEMKKGGNPVTF
jgi:hypothetical protein